MIVKAAVARSSRAKLTIETLELDEPQRDEVLVRLIASGISHADRDALNGVSPIAFPFVPGREGAGIVERVGEGVETTAPGDAVILGPAFCGACPSCLKNAPQECWLRAALNASGRRRNGSAPFTSDGTTINGFFGGQSSFGTHVLCHASCAVKVATDTPLEPLAFLGGEARIAASVVLSYLPARSSMGLIITGADALGLFTTIAAHAHGVKPIIVADTRESRRALASELGATLTVHTDDDLAAVVKSVTGTGVRLAVETTGHAAAIAACIASLAPGGTCGLLRTPDFQAPSADIATDDGKQVLDMAQGLGSPQDTIATLAAWHAEGRLPLDRIAGFYPFEHINDALRDLAADKIVKPIVRFSLGAFDDLDRAGIEGAMADAPDNTETGVDTEEQAPATAPEILM